MRWVIVKRGNYYNGVDSTAFISNYGRGPFSVAALQSMVQSYYGYREALLKDARGVLICTGRDKKPFWIPETMLSDVKVKLDSILLRSAIILLQDIINPVIYIDKKSTAVKEAIQCLRKLIM